MPLNVGYIQCEILYGGGIVRATIYYEPGAEWTPNQPLINGPRGYCLDLVNLSGSNRRVSFILPDGSTHTINVGQGDPVNNRSLTVTQVNNLGYFTRSDVSNFTLG